MCEKNFTNFKPVGYAIHIPNKTIHLRGLTLGDEKFLFKLIEDVNNHFEFTQKVLIHQSVNADVELLTNEELALLANSYIDTLSSLVKHKVCTSDDFSNFYKTFNAYVVERKEQYDEMSKRILSSIQSQLNLMNVIAEQIIPLAENIRKAIPWDFISSIAKQFAQLQVQLQESKLGVEKSILLLEKYHWFITPDFPVPFIYELANIADNSKNPEQDIIVLFSDYLLGNDCEELFLRLERWKQNSLLSKRIDVLENCVLLLKHRALIKINVYDLLVPTLFSQIDGIKSDYMANKGYPTNEYFNIVDRTGKNFDWRKHLNGLPLNDRFDKLGIVVLTNVLFQSTIYPDGTVPQQFSRHRVLHGAVVDYGTKENVLRALLIIDLLHHLS